LSVLFTYLNSFFFGFPSFPQLLGIALQNPCSNARVSFSFENLMAKAFVIAYHFGGIGPGTISFQARTKAHHCMRGPGPWLCLLAASRIICWPGRHNERPATRPKSAAATNGPPNKRTSRGAFAARARCLAVVREVGASPRPVRPRPTLTPRPRRAAALRESPRGTASRPVLSTPHAPTRGRGTLTLLGSERRVNA